MDAVYQTFDQHGTIRSYSHDTVLKAAMRELHRHTLLLTAVALEEAKYEELIVDHTDAGGLRMTVSDNAGS